MKKISWALVGVCTLSVAHASVNLDHDKRAWEGISSPLRMSSTFERNFTALPLSGEVSDPQKNWSSDYWARNKGGINYRWNAATPTGFNLVSPTKEQAAVMSESQLAALAPSEKWDLFTGRYDYPLKKRIASYASPSRPSWEGICDGWAAAALNHDEPKPITLANPDGIHIPFGSSDIKGLLSWYYAREWSGGYGMMGRRCNGTVTSPDRCVHDMNAGAFHIVLANRLGKDGVAFIADIDRNREVWNHLADSFTTSVLYRNLRPRSTSASGTVRVARVRSTVRYVWLLTRNTWEPVIGTTRQRTNSRTYEYYLDLNADGRIIGGDWISTGRPDFLWLETKATSFGGLFARLGELLDDAIVSDDTTETGTEPETTETETETEPEIELM